MLIDAPLPGALGWLHHAWYPRMFRYAGPILPHDPPARGAARNGEAKRTVEIGGSGGEVGHRVFRHPSKGWSLWRHWEAPGGERPRPLPG